jgi:glycosyltransferase involved in cell wall biosynthesis
MNSRLRILWLKSGPLHPLDTGGKIRTHSVLRELKKRHEITFLALASTLGETTKAAADEYSHRQIWIPWTEARKATVEFFGGLIRNLFSNEPYVIQKYFSREMARKIQELDASGQFDLIICDFLTPAVNIFARNSAVKTPILLFQHNVESLIWKRLYENASNVVTRAYLKIQWNRMKKFERVTAGRCDGVIGVSENDCRILQQEFGLKNVLGSIPTGVDCAYFDFSTGVRKPHSLVFLGSMDWMPNVDAVCYFAKEIFPAIKRQFADATFTIVGRNPTPRVKVLENRQDGIFVPGTVPDVRPYLAEAEVMIVPLRIGGGTRIKIFEGMATGIPIVSSVIGAEGLPVCHQENILLAETPAAFVKAICELFNRAELRKQIGKSGRDLVSGRFSLGSAANVFEEYCLETHRR